MVFIIAFWISFLKGFAALSGVSSCHHTNRQVERLARRIMGSICKSLFCSDSEQRTPYCSQ
jgi:hypothetical protein